MVGSFAIAKVGGWRWGGIRFELTHPKPETGT